MILKAFKFRLYPNKEQENHIVQMFGCNRYIYNKALETKIQHYQQTKKSLSRYELSNGLLINEKREHDWLRLPYSQTLQMTLTNLDIAFTKFFRKQAGFPKFKSRRDRQSVQYPQNVRVDWENSTIYFPKIKEVRAKLSRRFEGKIKTCTLSKTKTGKYFVSILVETPDSIPLKSPIREDTAVGVDLGIKSYICTSDGTIVQYPRFLRRAQQKLKYYQRRASKRNKGSCRRRKAMRYVTKLHEQIANQRVDWLHKLSARLTRENQTICLEDLNVAGMQKNYCLAQSVSDCSWSKFAEFLKYKSEWYGANLLFIGRFDPSSKTCSVCGYIKRDLQLSDREWDCPDCKTHHDRDRNAAQNIKNFALSDKNLVYRTNTGLEEPSELQDANTTALAE